MASIAERLALVITADPDDAIRGLTKLERSADRSIGATTNRVDDLGSSLTRIGATGGPTGYPDWWREAAALRARRGSQRRMGY